MRGPWRQNESLYDYVDDPTVAIDDHGAVAVAWVDQARKDVFFQRFSPDSDSSKPATKPINVSGNPATFSWLPRIIIAQNTPRQVFILWQEIIFSGGSHGGDILFARSEDGGATFSKPINLSQSEGGDGKGRIHREVWHNGSLDLAVGVDGPIYAAWTEYDGQLWFSRSTDGGKNFSSARHIAGGNGSKPARAPALATAPEDRVHLAWTVGEDDSADIRVATSVDGGATFGKPHIVDASDGYSDAPKLIVDSEGVLHLVYAESQGGPFDRFHIRYTQSTDGAQTFARSREISQPLPERIDRAAFPALDTDDQENIVVTWELFPDAEKLPQGLGVSISRDGGQHFSQPSKVPDSSDPHDGSNGSHQGLLMKKLDVNRSGEIAIVNSSLVPGKQSRVWLMRGKIRDELAAPASSDPTH